MSTIVSIFNQCEHIIVWGWISLHIYVPDEYQMDNLSSSTILENICHVKVFLRKSLQIPEVMICSWCSTWEAGHLYHTQWTSIWSILPSQQRLYRSFNILLAIWTNDLQILRVAVWSTNAILCIQPLHLKIEESLRLDQMKSNFSGKVNALTSIATFVAM